MKTDIEIAQEAKVPSIEETAKKIGLERGDLELYGNYMAKIPLEVLKRFEDQPNGKLIIVTAITATKAGEGKTVTTIGLVEALGRLGKKVMGCIREPSIGPMFGIKGGATGGGHSQVYPMWDIDLHFTGDIHAVGSAHNLLSAVLENEIARMNELNLDPTRIVFRKAIDMNCRELREIVVGLGSNRLEGGMPHLSGFTITAASEISAILALSTSIQELKERMGRIVVGYTNDGKPLIASHLECMGAMALLLKDAIKPNLVQTIEGDPFFVHGFPFANIAHGNNSVIATKYALKMADIVVTEGGFAADLGAEKFFDIVCRKSDLRPDCAVLVCSIRALKMHGGVAVDKLTEPNIEALQRGFANLDKHMENLRKFGVPVVVAINHMAGDTVQETEIVTNYCHRKGVKCVVSRVYAEGGKGGRALAEEVINVLENQKADFRFLYDVNLPIKEKIKILATQIYGAKDVRYVGNADRDIRTIEDIGANNLPICIAKTQHSITDDPKLKGAPRDWTLTVKEVYLSAGAGFIVPLCGDIMLIPGLPPEPTAKRMDITDEGKIIGLS